MKNNKLFVISVGSAAILLTMVVVLLNQLNKSGTDGISRIVFDKIQNKDFVVDLAEFNGTEKAGDVLEQAKKYYGVSKSIEAKAAREKELNKAAAESLEIFSDKKSYDMLMKKGAQIDADMARRMQTETMTASDREIVNILISELFSEEENFKVELKQYNSFNDLKNAFDKRSKVTGLFYGTDLLNEPMAYKDVKLEDIKKLLNSGASLPDNVLDHMIFTGNVDLAMELKSAGYNINANYIDEFRSMNAVEMQVESYATNPYAATAEEQVNTVKKLIDLGVSLKVDDGTRDALDIVLAGVNNQNADQANTLLSLAKNLHDLGIPVEQSHYQLLEQIKNKYPDLYSQYAQSFQ
jgi:hypothetical protein